MTLPLSRLPTHQVDHSKPAVLEDRRVVFDWATAAAIIICSVSLYINIYDLRKTVLTYRKDVEK